MKSWKDKYLDLAEKMEHDEFIIYQCFNCFTELTKKDIRVEIPDKNEVWCIKCFYMNHEIIS